MTEYKNASEFEVTGLNPETTYYFVVQTQTDPHYDNKNTVLSEYSEEVSATTFKFKEEEAGICFISTAAYGSPLHPYVETLRDFRDKYLVSNTLGRKFVDLYYQYSPFIANIIAGSKPLKVIVRIHLVPIIVLSYSMVHLGPIITGGGLLFILVLPIFFMLALRRRGWLG